MILFTIKLKSTIRIKTYYDVIHYFSATRKRVKDSLSTSQTLAWTFLFEHSVVAIRYQYVLTPFFVFTIIDESAIFAEFWHTFLNILNGFTYVILWREPWENNQLNTVYLSFWVHNLILLSHLAIYYMTGCSFAGSWHPDYNFHVDICLQGWIVINFSSEVVCTLYVRIIVYCAAYDDDYFEVCNYLRPMKKIDIQRLGGVLGLIASRLNHMEQLPGTYIGYTCTHVHACKYMYSPCACEWLRFLICHDLVATTYIRQS